MNARCIICGEKALIERRFSNLRYCIKHAKENMIISNIRRIRNKSNKIKQDASYIIIGRYPIEYKVILNVIEKYLPRFNDMMEITKEFHSENLYIETQKIVNEYSTISKLLANTNINVILLKTADLIVHDILYLVLNYKFNLIKSLISYERRLIMPFKNVFLTEVSKILGIRMEKNNYCTTYKFILTTINTRPTTIYGIINYIENLSSI
ncbi:MAG TPA: hypothetical protein EYH44_03635 [Thermoprotei archaeon]|nr:hypothetical protein [Thermoprotei archaeon]